jgi:hypothetical protein
MGKGQQAFDENAISAEIFRNTSLNFRGSYIHKMIHLLSEENIASATRGNDILSTESQLLIIIIIIIWLFLFLREREREICRSNFTVIFSHMSPYIRVTEFRPRVNLKKN